MVKAAYSAFFTVPQEPRAWYQIMGWWEARRPAYNLILFIAGIVSALVLLLFDSLPPNPDLGDYEFFSAIAFVILANFFYTFGWIVELGAHWLSGNGTNNIAPRLLKAGVVASLVITAVPGAAGIVRWLWRLV